MKRIGIFGGTFDPPHKGHIAIAEHAKKQLNLDAVFFVPAYKPPYKPQCSATTAAQRLMMTKLAIRGKKGFKISDIELKRNGISYTIDTLKTFRRWFPHTELVLIIGADNLAQFYLWKSHKKILQLAALAVYRRIGFTQVLRSHRIAFETIKGQFLKVSSTEIRKRIRKGKSISPLVQHTVRMYIKQKSLYLQP